MRAVVVESFDSSPAVLEVPKPSPAAHEVLVRIEASGLCHTDIHAAHGDWPVRPNLPFTPGHEGVGIVEEVGSAVEGVQLGDRVALPWFGYGCGHCQYCVDGRETLCESQRNTGYSVDGALREFAVADARYVVRVPDGIAPIDAAPLTCAGVTTYKAVKVAGVTPAERVAVFGIGGLGHLAVQYARIFGAFVTAVDVVDEKLRLAERLGADAVVNAADEDPVAALQRAGGVDVAIVLAASSAVFEQAFRSLRRGGRLVAVGLPKDGRLELPIFETVLHGLAVIGSIVGTREDLREVFALHAAGRTTVITETRSLEDVDAAMDEVLAGTVPARIVFDFPHA
ncbi:alcohol dehydrogenase AdhP [Amnibacterium kyonggiense]|uniref:Alcohol dehydrogenase n=1 Tax=Amnibacterium kyonggiense TaxID=595671 RepID=A0A4R7FKF8_9MICO|nr:alcohol dehydrogenase AdhP [Amnibacterium kyonggiense]TDS76840.1 propanol-preferring alcohol dehydrogenase [Amnibacterium kyonggiense]